MSKPFERYTDKTEFHLYSLQFFSLIHINDNIFSFLYILLKLVFANLITYMCVHSYFSSFLTQTLAYNRLYSAHSFLTYPGDFHIICTQRFLSVLHFQSSPFCDCYIVCWNSSLLIHSCFVSSILLFQIMIHRILFFICSLYLWNIFPYFQELLLKTLEVIVSIHKSYRFLFILYIYIFFFFLKF